MPFFATRESIPRSHIRVEELRWCLRVGPELCKKVSGQYSSKFTRLGSSYLRSNVSKYCFEIVIVSAIFYDVVEGCAIERAAGKLIIRFMFLHMCLPIWPVFLPKVVMPP